MQTSVRRLVGARLDPALNAPPALDHVLALAAHNFPITAWPILLGVVGAHRNARPRLVGDALVLTTLVVNTAPVGAALGAYGVALLPYLPQLPVEWAALALGASGWLIQRRRPLTPLEGLVLFAATVALVLGAAVIETVAVPHR
jgi:hypothetical protein